MNSKKISAVIITKNSQNTLKECLESLIKFDEIILLDNNSNDKTINIANEFNTKFKNLKIFKSDFLGFGALKNLAISYSKNEWILSIDSDEVLEDKTLNKINDIKLQNNIILTLPRKNLYDGEWIKACGWYPDYVHRIFNKNFTTFNDNLVHESIIIPKDANIIYLNSGIKHYTTPNIESIINKMNIYTTLSAQEKYKNNKKANMYSAIIKFYITFIKDYFFRFGFKYGYKGFIIALLNASGAFFKYAKLYEKNKRRIEAERIINNSSNI